MEGRFIRFRSRKRIVLTGSETEEEARKAESTPIPTISMPVFANVHEKRQHLKQKLAAGFRLLARFGWDEGVAGHMSVRDPEYPDLFWVNALGQYFGHIKASDLILVDSEGDIVRGSRPVNKAAFVIHSTVHGAREDINCVVHTHSMYGRTFSALGRPLLPITQDACQFYERHGILEEYNGVVFTADEGEKIVKALGENNKALILQSHGLLTTGYTVDEAIWNFYAMEKCCKSQLIAEAASVNGYHDLKLIEAAVAREVAVVIGDRGAASYQFQPMYNDIILQQPECLE
ncbi:class II aldolase/adducin N-terminal [Spinellus fusiger]|nr:class II aldolase/adducin N-terminal [Spinellus fusiger]